ncbi:CDP-glycerol glycerophosphotransferase family protein [Altererythrobacter sp. H2]|uniref:CDP-glycerol glycerophosphotransferase family protein n=1 Tax=Altererythrobacter sp. H2 TaxID=3108391 RepID=UPI002B4BEC6F|nr:CDP-glycerol glycerophosphotransferase family protein [Altererythrobacter sp. H2]WRK94742.1 CDP-glycerol glycerophosphotransferase family protein [Altererythrobacter sp. H2]
MPPSMRPRAVFLFNHDAAHQAAHIAGIMASLALKESGVECIAAYGTPRIAEELRRLVSPEAAARITWHDLSLPPLLDAALALPNAVLPARRLARLRASRSFFASADLVVSTERTCLRVRRRLRAALGEAAPRFVYVPHGSGDRNVAYHPELAQFDHMLLSGQKLVDEMVARGIATADRCHLIGYPKFDAIDRNRRQRFFANDRPTFVYNPHFDPRLSSWYDHGPDLLRRAAASDQYNLIFAPHVMLFRKTLHISPEYRTARRRPEIPAEALAAANVLIDIDGPNLFNMTYTLSADGYIGDMSSQVYEFLIRRRPVFFIDTHSADYPHEAANRAFWANGPVVTSVDELVPLLEDYQRVGEEYRPVQDRLFAYTIDDRPRERSVDRAAGVLARLAHSRHTESSR